MKHKAVVAVFCGTFLLLLPWVCVHWGLHHSLYYRLYVWYRHSTDPSEDSLLFKTLVRDNEARVTEAEQILSQQHPGLHLCPQTDDWRAIVAGKQARADIAVTIITSSREIYWNDKLYFAPKYLLQGVAKFITLLQHDRKYKYCLSVCQIDSKQSNDTDRVSKYVHVFQRPEESVRRAWSDPTDTVWHLREEKEKSDYVFCVRQTLQLLQADYLLMLEDDAIPRDDALDVIEHILDHRGNQKSWLPNYFKLYHPSRVEGYFGAEPEKLLGLLAFGAFFGTVLFGLTFPVTRYRMANPTTMWLLCMLYVVFMAVCVGRPHVNQLRRLSPSLTSVLPDSPCCTQAMLYPRDSAVHLSHHLASWPVHDGLPKDAAIEQYARTRWRRRGARLVQPRLFDHVGLVSAVHSGVIDPHLILE